jgi:hypothetical protein
VRQKTKQEDLMVRYLFEELTEEEQIQIEELFFTDNQYFEQLRSVEDALIDDYAQGTLTEHERRKVEGLLLSSPRQAREIEFVRDLIGYISENPTAELKGLNPTQIERPGKWKALSALLRIRNPEKRLALAITLLIIVIALFMAVWNPALQRKIGEMGAKQEAPEKSDQQLQQQIDEVKESREALVRELENERRKRDQLEQEMAILREYQPLISKDETVTLDLKPDSLSRAGGEIKTMQMRPNVAQVRIRITLGKGYDYKSYGVVIKTFDDRPVWVRDHISLSRTNPGKLVITLSARILNSDDYTLSLRGITETGSVEEIGGYSFRVRR